jgi:hypothetical protein
MGIDPHERKGLYCEWAFLTPDDRIIWFDWAIVPSGPLTEIFSYLRGRENAHASITSLVVMDPNRGATIQMGGSTWQQVFEEEGYSVMPGFDDIATGHSRLRDMLKLDEDGIPRMQWMENCRGRGGPIYQMTRYIWDDWGRGMKMEKDLKEKPREKNKDFPDVHRYVAAANLHYDDFMEDSREPLTLIRRAEKGLY